MLGGRPIAPAHPGEIRRRADPPPQCLDCQKSHLAGPFCQLAEITFCIRLILNHWSHNQNLVQLEERVNES